MSSRWRTFLWCLGRVTVGAVLAAECVLIGGSLALLVFMPLYRLPPLWWFALGALAGAAVGGIMLLDEIDPV
jgi:hypothetical protein